MSSAALLKLIIVAAFAGAAAVTAWRIRLGRLTVDGFLAEARGAGLEVLPTNDDETPVRMGRARVAATVRVFESTDEQGRKRQEMTLLWTLALRGDEAARGTLEVEKGAGAGYGGITVPLGRGMTATAKDGAGLDLLNEGAKAALVDVDKVQRLVGFTAIGPELGLSCARTRTDLATARRLAAAFEAAARALGR